MTGTNKEKEMQVLLKDGERIDDLQRNGLKIIQDPERFCFGMDAVLLSGFAQAKAGDRVLDLCTGTGILPLLLSARTKAASVCGLEIQEESADMACRSVLMNGLEEKIKIITGDVKEAVGLFGPASFEVITCNPPYMIAQHGIVGSNYAKTVARHEVLCTLRDVLVASASLLVPGGHLFMVHRPFRLAELIVTASSVSLEPKRLRIVYPFADKEPAMVLVEAVRGGKSGLKVEKPLILFEKNGEYTEEIKWDYGF